MFGNNQFLQQERQHRAAQIRRQRIEKARALGTHTEAEWDELCMEFGYRCVRCGIHAIDLLSEALTKDHVIPLFMGGCDCVQNLQPFCPHCNFGKGADIFNWVEYRRAHGFEAKT